MHDHRPTGEPSDSPCLHPATAFMSGVMAAVCPTEAAGGCDHAAARTVSVPDVIVRVLGPVDVLGAARPFRRAWTLDLVAYLAMHPDGVAADAWPAALWPDRLLSDPTRHSTVSAARRALGRSPSGVDHLPRSGGRLRLAPSVTTDWQRVASLCAPGSTPKMWDAALQLVRGRPFEGLRAVDWVVLEGIGARVEDTVVQLALGLAEHHLAAGRGRQAELAARRGLLASPYDERLYRALLRAADLQGNPAGVEAAMAELAHLLDGGQSGRGHARGATWTETPVQSQLACVHPETAALYRSLSRRWADGATAVPVSGWRA